VEKKSGRFGEFIGCSGIRSASTRARSTMGIKCPKMQRRRIRASGQRRQGRPWPPTSVLTAALVTRIAISQRPTCPLPNRARSAARRSCVEKRTKIGTVHSCLKEDCDWEKLVPEAQPQAQPEEAPVPVAAKS